MLSNNIVYHYVNTISFIKKVILKIIYDIWLSWDLVAIELPISYYSLGGTKTSSTLKQTCNFYLHVLFSMYALSLSLDIKPLKIVAIWSFVICRFLNGFLVWKHKWTCIKCLKSCWVPILVWITRAASK